MHPGTPRLQANFYSKAIASFLIHYNNAIAFSPHRQESAIAIR
ncbi:hypothetical protein [Coleofasciculus sp. FACHB-SPT36]|nr:hypothetical protein [Coleofasciculus sp. FACHB-SPT36]